MAFVTGYVNDISFCAWMLKPFVHVPTKLSAFPESSHMTTMSPLSEPHISDIPFHSWLYPLVPFPYLLKNSSSRFYCNLLCLLLPPQSLVHPMFSGVVPWLHPQALLDISFQNNLLICSSSGLAISHFHNRSEICYLFFNTDIKVTQ